MNKLNRFSKIFIKKQFNTQLPNTTLYWLNNKDMIYSLNEDLYESVRNKAKGYYYSQSYWDKCDNSVLFTDSYWENSEDWTQWLKSEERQQAIKLMGECTPMCSNCTKKLPYGLQPFVL